MKPIWKSKTFYMGLGLVGWGIFQVVQGEVDLGVKTILEGLGLIFLRTAVK